MGLSFYHFLGVLVAGVGLVALCIRTLYAEENEIFFKQISRYQVGCFQAGIFFSTYVLLLLREQLLVDTLTQASVVVTCFLYLITVVVKRISYLGIPFMLLATAGLLFTHQTEAVDQVRWLWLAVVMSLATTQALMTMCVAPAITGSAVPAKVAGLSFIALMLNQFTLSNALLNCVLPIFILLSYRNMMKSSKVVEWPYLMWIGLYSLGFYLG